MEEQRRLTVFSLWEVWMKKLMIALVAGCMSAAVAGAYAAQGSPADSDKAGRMGPGTAAGQAGATDPNAPSKAAPMKSGATAGSASATTGASSTAGAGGAAATSGAGGSTATAGGGMEEPKGKRSRRARAAKG